MGEQFTIDGRSERLHDGLSSGLSDVDFARRQQLIRMGFYPHGPEGTGNEEDPKIHAELSPDDDQTGKEAIPHVFARPEALEPATELQRLEASTRAIGAAGLGETEIYFL